MLRRQDLRLAGLSRLVSMHGRAFTGPYGGISVPMPVRLQRELSRSGLWSRWVRWCLWHLWSRRTLLRGALLHAGLLRKGMWLRRMRRLLRDLPIGRAADVCRRQLRPGLWMREVGRTRLSGLCVRGVCMRPQPGMLRARMGQRLQLAV